MTTLTDKRILNAQDYTISANLLTGSFSLKRKDILSYNLSANTYRPSTISLILSLSPEAAEVYGKSEVTATLVSYEVLPLIEWFPNPTSNITITADE